MSRPMNRRSFAKGLATLAAACMAAPRRGFAEYHPLRAGVSLETLAGANVNDARAAYRVWGVQIAKTLNLPEATMIPEIFVPSAQMIQMIRNNQIECFALTGLEYVRALEWISSDMAVIENYATDGMDYVLLVRQSAPYQRVEDLRHGKLSLHHHRDASLLRPWLSILLANQHATDLEGFFDTVESHEKINDILLPLFFGRTHAAGLTRRAFQLAIELNPQLGRELRVLTASPKVIPAGFWFRKGCDPEQRKAFMQAMVRLRSVPAGRQVLALYQSSGFVTCPGSVMNGTVELIQQYDRIRKRSS